MEFVEVETRDGVSISIGDWVPDGEYMLLVIDDPRAWKAMAVELAGHLNWMAGLGEMDTRMGEDERAEAIWADLDKFDEMNKEAKKP